MTEINPLSIGVKIVLASLGSGGSVLHESIKP